MPKPVLTAHQIELRAKLHTRCETVNRQNQTRTMLTSMMRRAKSGMILEVLNSNVPINCRSTGPNFDVEKIGN